MKLISHRGNTSGPHSCIENHPSSVRKVLDMGLDCEIDVYWTNAGWHLGHNKPEYLVDEYFLLMSGLWVHAKNIEALHYLKNFTSNYFWHESDSYTLTSRGYIWTYPDEKNVLTSMPIAVMPEKIDGWDIGSAGGICSDYIGEYII